MRMRTNTKTTQQMLGGGNPCWLRWLHRVAATVVMLVGLMAPQGAWADLRTMVIGDVNYYVLNDADDWYTFSKLVDQSGGKQVNAIMNNDITVYNSIALAEGVYYTGTFNGNGHTLNVQISGGGLSDIGPFAKVKDGATFRDLHVTGSVSGGDYIGGLIGRVQYSGHPTIRLDRVWVSANVTSSSNHASGIIGHASQAITEITDCRYDGKINSSTFQCCILWSDDGDERHWNRVYEKATTDKSNRFGFSYLYYFGSGGEAWGGDGDVNCSLLLSSHKWTEMASGCNNITDYNTVLGKMNNVSSDKWKSSWYNGAYEAVPIMQEWYAYNGTNVNFSTYDMVPSKDEKEKGMLKIPFSCDQPVHRIYMSYTNQNGKKIEKGIDFTEKTYSGFVTVSATDQHRSMHLYAYLPVDGCSQNRKDEDDRMMHKAEELTATQLRYSTNHQLSDGGAVQLTWKVKNTDCKDIIDGDQFIVLRGFENDVKKMKTIGSVLFEQTATDYSFKDSLITADLTEAQLQGGTVTAYYVVMRASARELWGLDDNATAASKSCTLENLHLLKVSNAYSAAWNDYTARSIKVCWSYEDELSAVWDSRAQMQMRLMTVNRDGHAVDTTTIVLTPDEIAARQKTVTLNRSCVSYKVGFVVTMNDKSFTYERKNQVVREGDANTVVIRSTADWNTFANRVKAAKGNSEVNAILMADITVSTQVGDNYNPYLGTFEGNGHTLTLNINSSGTAAPFPYVKNSTFRNLHVVGTVNGGIHTSGLVGFVNPPSTVVIEMVHMSATINCSSSHAGGFIGHTNDDGTNTVAIQNCRFDGSVKASSCIGVFCGWGMCARVFEHNYENGTYSGGATVHMNYRTSGPITTCSATNYSAHDWTSLSADANKNVTDQQKAVTLLGSGWHLDGGKAVPYMTPAFYYENLGHIDPLSLNVQTNPTSALLTWANVDDEPVDYYEVWRKDKNDSDWGTAPIATQITERQYLDKETSPVHQYIYKVRGVTDCEGTSYNETEPVEGFCEQFGTVTGHLRFLDGTGIPGKKVFVTVGNEEVSYTTDESGFFRLTNLPYVNKEQTHYSISVVGIMGLDPVNVTFGTAPGDNVVTGKVIEVGESVKLSGYVMYDGTSIPVQGVSFKVDGYEVKNASGRVETDHEGKFSFRMLKGAHDSIQAVKDGHVFWRDGFYHAKDNDPDTLKKYDFQTDKAGIRFYDQTRVKLIGRVVGGKTQGELPLGNALSKNNLGDDLQMVFVLEGDNASRLVFDNQDRSKTTRDEVFLHELANKNDGKHTYQTKVHTTINRMVVTPDPYTGEYEVLLPPVKWKIQQITAKGYSTLFQEGQVGDVLDLSDSITLHRDSLKGAWKTSGDHTELSQVVEEYHAKYSRVYRSPILIEYKQQGFGKFDFFGDQYYSFKNVTGSRQKLTLAYEAPLGGTKGGVIYTFGYPVFSIDKNYPLWLTASEKYYYNNNTKSDTVDVVSIPGGVVTIHNGFYDQLHRDTVHLDSLGQATYVMQIAQKPYLLTGDDALQTMSVTLLQDGTHYEAEPLKGYVFSLQQATGAQDILSYSEPLLIDILRDPPGGSSHATLSKGSTLKRAYTMEMEWKAGMQIGLGAGTKFNTSLGIVAAPFGIGVSNDMELTVKMGAESQINMVFSGSGERAFEYTMTTTEDISTSSDPKLVGADGDLFIGTVQNIVVKPATAIRAIPDSTFSQAGGLLESGRMVEIAQGLDDSGNTLHLVRDEVLTYGPTLQSNFVHSQHYIVNQLIPELTEQCQSLMFTGTADEARAQANATGKPVYRSKVGRESEDFGVKYEMILPEGASAGEFKDEVNRYHKSLMAWIEMLARNEDEKLNARDFVANYDVDGGSTVSYSETFESSYSAMNSFVSPFTPITNGYFDNGLANAAAFIGTMAARLIGFSSGTGLEISVEGLGVDVSVKLSPVASFNVTPKHTESKTFNRTESFEVSMDKRSHLDFDVYRVSSVSEHVAGPLSEEDVFVGSNFWDQVDYNNEYLDREFKTKSFRYPMSFVYRTRGGATCRPWEDERRTKFSRSGTVLDVRTKKIENPIIKIDKQSVSGVPYGEPARFKLYITNESEQPEATYIYFDLYQADMSNPDGAHLMIDGMPLTGTSRTIEVHPGQVTEKTLDVYAGEKFDYEGLRIGIISQDDVDCYSEVAFDVHYLQTAGPIAISSPGDKWIMNCDAPQEKGKGWYLPVVIGGFDKNQHNFDHIEFQYKETTRGDDYWTNLCGYYADSTLYRAASGTKAMIPENGNIMTRFFGEGTVMEKGYDLRAVLFCRNGNAFLTSESKVLTGVKDTRRPQLFGTPEPKDGILSAGDNIIFNFSEDIEYNYLQATTNFEAVGETNETAVQEAPSLQFTGDGYARSQARRNFADKNVTVEVMVKPESTGQEMPIFSHGSDGKHLQLWLTKEHHLMAIVENGDQPHIVESEKPIGKTGFQRVALVLDNENRQLMLYNDEQVATMDSVSYSGFGPLTFGYAETVNSNEPFYYTGRMLQGRLWDRKLDLATLNRYGGQLLTGYELGLVDYYPMNDGTGDEAKDYAQGGHLMLKGASWAQPEGMALKITPSVEATHSIVIRSEADWTKFTEKIAQAEEQYDLHVTLAKDLSISKPAAESFCFRGTFEGNGHTLNCNLESKDNVPVSPFALVGNATIRNLRTTGTVATNVKNMGGLIGTIYDDATVTIENCRSSVKLVSSVEGEANMGGFVGNAGKCKQLTITDCAFDGRFEGENASGNGGFVGWMENEGKAELKNCFFSPDTIKTDDCATWVRTENVDNVTLSDNHCTYEYNPPSKDYFRIYNATDWATFCSKVDAAKGNSDVNAVLMADITVTQAAGEWNRCSYRGTFDGNGHTINMDITSTKSSGSKIYSCIGLFAQAQGYTIKNLRLTGKIVAAPNNPRVYPYAGGLVGESFGLNGGTNYILNCRVSAHIKSTSDACGFVGSTETGDKLYIKDCLFDGIAEGAKACPILSGTTEAINDAQIQNFLEHGEYIGQNYGMILGGDIVLCNTGNKTNNWTYHEWYICNLVGSMSPSDLAAKLGNDNWHVVDDEVVPIAPIKYGMIPGDASGKAAEEIIALLGSNWTKDADGNPVPKTGRAKTEIKLHGLPLQTDLFERDDEQDYTLMFWFKTAEQNGTLLANGSGAATDEDARNSFFIGFEDHTLKYRTNGREFALGDNLCNDTWHHYAMTVNRTRNVASIYIDNELKAQLATDTLGGMLGNRFFLGNMVWQESGDPNIMQDNPLTGYIDGLALFEQALPATLVKRYSTKSPMGTERGLKVYMDFDRQEMQKSGELALMPYALSKVVKRDNDGKDTGKRDSVFAMPVDSIMARIDQHVGAPLQAAEHLRVLNFSYIGRTNQLEVNIDEDNARINKRNIYVTVSEIPDKNGNFMASAATEYFYVDRNPLKWAKRHVIQTLGAGMEESVEMDIVNKSGKAHTFTIDNLPRWLTVNKVSDEISPMDEEHVIFTVSKDLNVGTYDQIIYVTDEDGMSEPLFLELTIEGEAPQWTIDPERRRYSMNIVAQVYLNNILVTDKRDKVAAFDADGNCVGVNNIDYDAATGRSMLYLTAYDSTAVGDLLFFRLWHYTTGKTMQISASPAVTFAKQTIAGTVDDPVLMYADNMYLQTIDLAEGWNWMSFNVYNARLNNLQDIQTMFNWQNGDILTEDTEDLTLAYRNGIWMSNTDDVAEHISLSQRYSYRVKVQKAQKVELWGRAYKSKEERTLTIKPGWNSIGYTPLLNLPVATALADYFDRATSGDVVKSQTEFAMFTSDGKGGGQWLGNLRYMQPGEGYQLYRQKADTVSFTYPFYEPGETFIDLSQPQSHRAPMLFSTTMSLVAEAVDIALEEGDRLVAYAGGEQVGEAVLCSAKVSQNTQQQPLFFLSIAGDVEAPLSFAIMRNGETIATTEEVMTYRANGISGSPTEPTQISFVKTTDQPQQGWYTLDGIKLPAAPKRSGVYLYNGRKRIVK